MQFTTSRGVTVEIRAIQTLIEKFEASARLPKVPEELKEILGDLMPKPEAPTYDVKTITGHIETHFHDDKTTKTPEVQAKWEQYKKDLETYENQRNEQRKKLVLLHGLSVEMPNDDAWVSAQEELGIIVPTEPQARKLHYIKTEVIGGIGDFVEIMRLGMTLGLPEEQRRLADELFRHTMGRYAAPGTADTQGQVDKQPEIRESGSGNQSGDSAADKV